MTAHYGFAFACTKDQHDAVQSLAEDFSVFGYTVDLLEHEHGLSLLFVCYALDKAKEKDFVPSLLATVKRLGVERILYTPVGGSIWRILEEQPEATITLDQMFEEHYPTLTLSKNRLFLLEVC